MKTQSIRFYYRGAIHEVAGLPATRTVLQHLREDLHCTGTKEGCAEGDCGACTVVIGACDTRGELTLRAINACIQLLPTLDGRALFTVEDLRGADGALHPVQQALVDCHGSQCGFCTPGFVMSLWALYQNHGRPEQPPSRAELTAALSGNLCRCTGYRPILEAGVKMFDLATYPRPPLDANFATAAVEALRRLERGAPMCYSAPRVGTVGVAHAADAAAPADPQGVATAAGDSFHAPLSLADFAALRAARPNARILAGSTDIGLWITKQFCALGDILYVGNVAELKLIELDETALTIGAAVSLEDAFRALTALYPELIDIWTRFASLPIRHAGTLGGNVANGSPIGDSMPPLIALGGEVLLQSGSTLRALPLESFYQGYQKTALRPGEFVRAVRVPRPAAALRFRAYKLAKRYDQDISAVCAGFAIRLVAAADVAELRKPPAATASEPPAAQPLPSSLPCYIAQARIAFGGMAATPRRAALAEAALVGASWTQATVRVAMALLGDDFQPLSDMRATSAYRLKTARNLLLRFYLETRPESPLSSAEVNAFAAVALTDV